MSLKMIAEGDGRRIRSWGERLDRPLSIRLLTTGDSRTSDFVAFCEELQELVPKLQISRQAGAVTDFPALQAGDGWSYHALPCGTELPPFLELLSMLDGGPREVPDGLVKRGEKIVWPAELKLYVTPQCPFCPRVLRQLQPLPLASRLVHLTVIDGMLFPELAERDGVRTVPTVILDERFRWAGSIAMEPLLDALVHRQPQHLSTDTWKGMIKEGGAEQVAGMMVEANLIFPAFLELLTDSEWSTRLGAMVVVEEIAERNPPLAAAITNFLVARIDDTADAVTGDLIYLLGSVGSPECIPKLEELQRIRKDGQLQEVLREALEKFGT